MTRCHGFPDRLAHHPPRRRAAAARRAAASSTTSRVPGLLHVAFVRSPHPHALISGIDKDAALALPGVHAVLTLDDLAKVMTKRRMVRHSNSGMPLDKAWLLRARQRRGLLRRRAGGDGGGGRPLHRRGRRRAGRRSTTTSCRSSPTCARRSRPARRRCGASSTPTSSPPTRSSFGDTDAAFAKAAHVFKQELWQHRGAAHSIEARGTVAEVRSADGGITVHASTQKAHDLQQTLTTLIDFDESLRVVAPDIGGGFGAKLCVYSEDVAVVAAAKLLEPLAQMDRGPPRVFHQRGARARPVLVAGDRGRAPTPRCSASAASCCTTPAPTRCRTRTSRTTPPRP